jgi:hypothetical protein
VFVAPRRKNPILAPGEPVSGGSGSVELQGASTRLRATWSEGDVRDLRAVWRW